MLQTSALDRFDTFDLIDSFGQFRSEVAMMSRLQHAHIVQMKWASIQMIAFAMEFSPEGDLSSVLEKKLPEFKSRHVGCKTIHDTVIDRLLTYKIVVQVIFNYNNIISQSLLSVICFFSCL